MDGNPKVIKKKLVGLISKIQILYYQQE